jgi:hypothetical protein
VGRIGPDRSRPKVPKIGFNKFRPSPTVYLPDVDENAALVKIIDFGLLAESSSWKTDRSGLKTGILKIRDYIISAS